MESVYRPQLNLLVWPLLCAECLCFFQNEYVEVLTLNVIVFGVGGLGSCLEHEDGILKNEISALMKKKKKRKIGELLFSLWLFVL